MLKLKKAIKTAFRHRVLIACILLSILVVASGLAVAKGTVVVSAKGPSEVAYGTPLSFKGSAFMSDVYFEYYYNGTWSTVAPTEVGEYKVRACSKGSFGWIKRSRERKFSILPRPIEVVVSSPEIIYGDTPIAVGNLKIGDYFGFVDFTYQNVTQESADITPNLETIQILNQWGKDVTNCYSIQVRSLGVTILKRQLAIGVSSFEKTYDGTALVGDAYEITAGTTAYQDVINASFKGSITDVGTVENVGQFSITAEDGTDVTCMYDILVTAGFLTINPRPITVATGSLNETYDGNEFSNDTLSVVGGDGLVEGQTLGYTYLPTITDVGEKDNAVSVVVYDKYDTAEEVDVSRNYQITYQYGKLTVLPRPVMIATSNYVFTYNGDKNAYPSYEQISQLKILENHDVTPINVTTIKNVGTIENKFELSVKDGEKDVTSNYEFIYTYGQLEVIKRQVTITSRSNTFTYNGEDQSFEYFDAENVVSFHSVLVDSSTTIKNVGTKENELTYVIYSHSNIIDDGLVEGWYENVTSNYEIIAISGTLTVIPRPIVFIPKEVRAIYDGTVHKAIDVEVSPNSPNEQVEWHTATGTFKTSEENQRKYAGEACSEILSVIIQDKNNNDEDVTANYAISFEKGRIIVEARTIRLQPERLEKIYDGELFSAENTGIIDVSTGENEGLVVGDVISEYIVQGFGTDAGTYVSTVVEGSVVILSNGINISQGLLPSYNVVYVDGEIEIKQRPISIKPKDVEKIYDGEPLFATEYEWCANSPYGLVAGHIIYTFETEGSQIDAGQSESVISNLIITTADYSRDVTFNYEIIKEKGQLIVHKRPITIKPVDQEVVYDGKKQRIKRVQVADNSPYGLVTGHNIQSNYGYFTDEVGPNVGSYECSILEQSAFIASASGGDISCNYQITYQTGWLTITKRVIFIKPKDLIKEYDGTPLTCKEVETAPSSPNTLIAGHLIEIVTTGSVTEVAEGQVVNSILSHTITENGQDVAFNYEVYYFDGVLSVFKRNITVRAGDASKIYDGTPLVCTNVFVMPLANGHYISQCEIVGSITNVGTADNVVIEDSVVISNGVKDVTANYNITFIKGVLEVVPRPICVVTKGNTWEYDATEHYNLVYDAPFYYEGEDWGVTTPPTPALVLDHYLEVVDYAKITDVGEKNNEIRFKVLDGSLADVTYNYDIILSMGKLIVTPINIVLESNSNTWNYDGYYHYDEGFKYSSAKRVLENHTIVVVERTEIRNATQIVGVENKLTYDIIDENGISVMHNYEVGQIRGILQINMSFITFISASNSWIYDGMAHSENSYTYEGVIGYGDEVRVVGVTEITDVGYKGNNLVYTITYEGEDVTHTNYFLRYQTGTLRVSQRNVVLSPQDEKVYNGSYQSAEKIIAIDGTSLADGHVAVARELKSYLNVGRYQVDIVPSEFYIKDSRGRDVTVNYAVKFKTGEFIITPRPLTITANSDIKIYDSLPLTNDGYTVEGLLEDLHVISSIEITGEITDVGVVPNVPSNAVITTLDGEPIIETNYEIKYVNGRLKVTGMIIEVATGSAEKRFDGVPLSCDEYEILSGELLEGHVIEIEQLTQLNEVGTKRNDIKFKVTSEDGTEDYSIFYEFVITKPGVLKITPIIVTVTTGSDEKYYDGTPLTCDDYQIVVQDGEVEGHVLTVDVTGSITEPGEANNTFVFKAFCNGEEVNHGYEVIAEYGTLIVKGKTNVILKPRDEVKEYDGTPLVAEELEGFEELAQLGYYYENLVFGGYQIGYGRSESWIENIDIFDAEGNPIDLEAGGYKLVLSKGLLEVTKTQVVIRVFDVSKVYDGKPISYYEDDYMVVDSKGLTLDIKLGGQLTNVGTLTYDEIKQASTYTFYDEYGNDVTDNYFLLIEGNPLEVKPRSLYVTSMSAKKEYDGEELSNGIAWISKGSLVKGQTITFTITSSIVYVGSIENVIDSIVIMAGDIDVTKNYVIDKTFGTLEVVQSKK